MLPWWGWVLVWLVLLAGGALLIGAQVRRVWRSARELGREMSRATRVLEALESVAGREPPGLPDVAVTQEPHRLRRQYEEQRAASVAARRARRDRRAPPWTATYTEITQDPEGRTHRHG